MYKVFIIFSAILLLSCSSQRYYIVRHAERASAMATDPPLSAEGEKQAQDMAVQLRNAKIKKIFSTDFIRTRKTAEPLSLATGVPVEIYDARNPSAIVGQLRAMGSGNVLVVGHSNTVDDLVNGLTGEKLIPADLPDTEYGMIYLVKKKNGKYSFEKFALPKITPR
jgi:2,3-bisphosphoglycerate-dependent phosphoglycerate mutase